jgi:hypothetical protein
MKVKLYGDCAVVTGKTKLKGKYKGEDVQDQFRWDIFTPHLTA